MNDVNLLRQAAKRMRALAGAASRGPWETAEDGLVWADRLGDPVSGSTQPEDAEHVASWHPEMAFAVAELLDEQATQLEKHIPRWTAPRAVAHDNPERLAELVEHHFGRALTIARRYLGGGS